MASFCYAMLALVSVGGGAHGDFVPHLSITVTFMLTLADVAILIFFFNHIATMIQLPMMIASIATKIGRRGRGNGPRQLVWNRRGARAVGRGIVGAVCRVWCPDPHTAQRLSSGYPT